MQAPSVNRLRTKRRSRLHTEYVRSDHMVQHTEENQETPLYTLQLQNDTEPNS